VYLYNSYWTEMSAVTIQIRNTVVWLCMTFIVRLKYINIIELYNHVPHMIVIFFIAGVHTFLMILQWDGVEI